MHAIKKLAFLLLIGLTACHATPPAVPGMKIGKPYAINGTTYYPEYDPTYDKIGMASWYGPGFHGKYTANGERFNQNDLTAAHPTLPMPSLVRVTNLENGKSIIVRINDRGPFKSNRIIDLSKKSAESIGIYSTTQVRVQYLKKETDDYAASNGITGSPAAKMVAYNNEAEDTKNAYITRSTEPNSQIVESSNASTQAGQTVDDAAPVMTVSSGELSKPSKAVQEVASADDAQDADNASDDSTASEKYIYPDPIKEQAVKAEPSARAPVAAASAPSKVATVADGAYLIQVGSFAAEDNARKLTGKLEAIAKVAIDKIDMGEKTWWRVRLGPFADKATADDALSQVRAASLPDARIIHQ